MVQGPPGRPFAYTPSWAIAAVCFFIVFISACVERALHKLGKWFKHTNQVALFEALEKLKEELMLLGFISLLLTVLQRSIIRVCVGERYANIMLPCVPKHHAVDVGPQHCPKGQVPLLSVEALHDLHIFIFVLAVVYVVFCASTMLIGGIRIRQWRHWERPMANRGFGHVSISSRGLDLDVSREHLEEFKGRAGNYWRKFHVISWINAFFKQFYGSIQKSDYIALRSGFIRKHCSGNPSYNFHKYMLRTLEHDFKKIVGVSWYLWIFVVIFLLLNVKGWHSFFLLSFLPLVLLVIVGAKLEHIITELAMEAARRDDNEEDVPFKPSDELFWFRWPPLVLYLIHFILFQNSFEIAFFLWILATYSFKSCMMEGVRLIIPRLVIGVIVQVLCSYSTLPLYALVSQMGSEFKETVFNAYSREPVMSWITEKKSDKFTSIQSSVDSVHMNRQQEEQLASSSSDTHSSGEIGE